jgi:ABC-type Na+ efflux pump permease subunit
MLSCSALRTSLLVSLILLLSGGAFILLAPFVNGTQHSTVLLINSVGFAALISAVGIFAATLMLALLPSSRRRLKTCNH